MVAAAKLRRAQEQVVRNRPYTDGLAAMLGHVAAKVDHSLNPYLQDRDVHRIAYLVLAADRGLCGSFNANVLRRASVEIAAQRDLGREVDVVPVGKRSNDFFSRRDYRIATHYAGFFNTLGFADAVTIASFASQIFLQDEVDAVQLVYTTAKSPVKQTVVVEQLLPIRPQPAEKGRFEFEYLFEPSPEKMLAELCPKSVNIMIWRALMESYHAELGARMVAMDAATENAEEMINNLTLYYNKVRQSTITREITEIVGGAEALA